MTDPTKSKRVLEICDAVVLLSPGARDAFLAEACADDPELRDWVERLLQAVEDSGTFMQLEEPADPE